jgi:sugar/nucleoside kinase (ribokinase family)
VRIPLRFPGPGPPFDVVGLGLNSVDLLATVTGHPRPNSKQRAERLTRQPGGQAATAMVTCARLGWKARYIGRFGDDEHGALGIESLRREGVDVSASVTVKGARNQVALILVDARSGDRTIVWDRDPALTMRAADVPRDAVVSGRILLVDCHETEAALEAARHAKAAGMPTVIDVEEVRPRIDELLRTIDVIIASEDFPSALTGHGDLGRALSALADEFRPAVACVTLGRRGSLALVGGREIRTPGFTVTPCIDTTGAGDVFRGAFIAAYLAGGADAPAEDVLAYANAAAALKCRRLGARDAIPTRQEVEALVASR